MIDRRLEKSYSTRSKVILDFTNHDFDLDRYFFGKLPTIPLQNGLEVNVNFNFILSLLNSFVWRDALGWQLIANFITRWY